MENTFGSKVKKLREERALSVAELAKMTGLSSRWIGECEKNTNVSIKTLNKIAKALGVHITDLMPSKEEEAA